MNLTEMIAALRFRLGNKKGLDADILREINFAQERLEKEPTLDYWFLVNFSTILLTQGDNNIPFPTGYLREYDDHLPSLIVSGGYVPLLRLSLEDARAEFGTASGAPRAYTIVDGLFKVFPTPDKEYQMDLPFIKAQPILTEVVVENEWTLEASQILMNKAGIALSQALRDQEALANFTNDFNVAFGEMASRVVQREEANMDRQRGGYADAIGR